MPFDLSLLGQPVELPQISRELKKLWESSGGAKSRASLVNFAVYCQGVEALESNTQLISEFTVDHACRAMLLASVPDAPQTAVRSWINAHCHLSRAGAKQVCCEQITILLEGTADRFLANILFANLDSDLPLYLWWQGELTECFSDQLATWVDRLIYDSRDWKDPIAQFALLQQSLKRGGARMILCDLNWTRTLHLRQALAQMFDHPENLSQVNQLTCVRITHAPGYRCTSLFFAAWISAQLKWEFVKIEGSKAVYRGPAGNEVTCELVEAEGAPISRCELCAGQPFVTIRRDTGSAFHQAQVRLADGREYVHLLPAGADNVASLLDDELTFGGRHRVYLKALAAAQKLLGQ